ncbi:hypothetical protein, partial [Streptomyces chumphonensis]|uniref:hypothetical protein n=1 Tax=Streptomyces chumphonensis TaxID=1214925 RepID=UPI00362CFE6D
MSRIQVTFRRFFTASSTCGHICRTCPTSRPPDGADGGAAGGAGAVADGAGAAPGAGAAVGVGADAPAAVGQAPGRR